MPPAVQIVHSLHGEKDHEIGPGGLFRLHEPQVQLSTSYDDLLEELIDRVLISVGKAGYRRAHLLSNPADEPRSRQIPPVRWRIRKEILEVAVVEIRVIQSIVFALFPVVLTERFADARQWIDLPLRYDARAALRHAAHQSVHVLELALDRPALVAGRPHRLWIEPDRE